MKVTISFIICVVGYVLSPTASQDPTENCVNDGDEVCVNCITTGICDGTPGNFTIGELTTCNFENDEYCDNTIAVGFCFKTSASTSICAACEEHVCLADPNNENFHINCDDISNPLECPPENVIASSCTCSTTAETDPSSVAISDKSTSTTDTTYESTTDESITDKSTSDESTSSSKATDESTTTPEESTTETSDKSTETSKTTDVSTTTDQSTSSKSTVTTTPNESTTTTTETTPNESTTTTAAATTPIESTTTTTETTTPKESTTTTAATTTPIESTTTTTTTMESTTPEIICPDDCPFAADPNSCERYYQCTSDGPIPFSCPSTFCFVQDACQCLPGGTTTPVTCPDDCPFVDDPNDDCSSYFSCLSGGDPIQYTCPNQKCFDQKSCGCIDTSSKTPTTSTTSSMTTTSTATTTTTSRMSTAPTCSPGCPFVEIPDEDCHNFYICSNGDLVPSVCPGDLCFDQNLCQCVL